MNRCLQLGLICCAALVAGEAIAADPPSSTGKTFAPAPSALAAPVATQAPPRTPSTAAAAQLDPTILSPKGFVDDELPAYDDFLHRAVATKRVELLRFVDRDDRRVFLGLTRDGTLGIHVQQRDRR
jgi:hypothetical protein